MWLRAVGVLGGVLGGLAILFGVVLLVWLAPPALYKDLSGKDRASAEATTRTGLIAGLAGLAALGSVAFTARTYRLTEQGQLTDRYTKAIEQLGSDKLDIRLGGVYALERIARDSKRDHPTVVEVLGAFVRERSNPHRCDKPTVADVLQAFLDATDEAPDASGDSPRRPPADVQAALTVLGRLPKRSGVGRGDLHGAYLSGALLEVANLRWAWLEGANLTGARLVYANLFFAQLRGANLTGARLEYANLGVARLEEANLTGADLSRAWLVHANLTGARCGGADLSGANLGGARLREARELTQDQLNVAWGDAWTQLPEGLSPPSSWAR